jgi:hypothetical protein
MEKKGIKDTKIISISASTTEKVNQDNEKKNNTHRVILMRCLESNEP